MSESKIRSSLRDLGLSETEAKLYLAGLGSAGIGVKELGKATGINRTTIYHALETLNEKGLVSKRTSGTGAKLLFTMESPTSIRRLLDREIETLSNKREELDTLIPLLEHRTTPASEDFQVSHFEGLEGIKLVVEEALYCKSRRWDIIAPKKNFFSEFDAEYAGYYLKTRRQNGIRSRSLWEFSPDRRALTTEERRERDPRYLPPVMYGRFRSVIIIFDDCVAFISSLDSLSAILIRSDETRQTMSAIFEGLWSASTTKPDDRKKVRE